MCVIAICNTKRIPKPEFFEAFRCNSHGCGIAWRENDKIRYIKGIMDVNEAWKLYNDTINKDIFPHIVHFRVGSPVTKELTHPFIISDDSELLLNYEGNDPVLFHNGVVTNWKAYLVPTFIGLGSIPEGDWSDTRLIALLVKKLTDKVLDYIDGKFVILSKEDITIVGKWEDEKNGIIWSNGSYKVVVHSDTCYSQGSLYHCQQFKNGVWETTSDDGPKPLKSVLDYGHFDSLQSLGSSLEFIV